MQTIQVLMNDVNILPFIERRRYCPIVCLGEMTTKGYFVKSGDIKKIFYAPLYFRIMKQKMESDASVRRLFYGQVINFKVDEGIE